MISAGFPVHLEARLLHPGGFEAGEQFNANAEARLAVAGDEDGHILAFADEAFHLFDEFVPSKGGAVELERVLRVVSPPRPGRPAAWGAR